MAGAQDADVHPDEADIYGIKCIANNINFKRDVRERKK